MDNTMLDAWTEIRQLVPALHGPFFDPAFVRAVHETVGPVTLLIGQEKNGEISTIWPVHRRGARVIPVGWPGADFQGPLCRSTVDPTEMLTAIGARTLFFDHLLRGLGVPEQVVHTWRPSPYLDVTGGLDGYLGRASRSGRDNLSQARRRARKASAELGELRFTPESTSFALLGELIRLKRRQYAATGSGDFFAESGHRELLEHLFLSSSENFAGVLSAVHCGDTLLAAHFGLRANGVLHWWFPVYEPEVARFSPGWILLRELISAAPSLGVDRIDLGRGDDEYKRRAKTGEVFVGKATISTSRTVRLARAANDVARGAVRRSGLAPRVRRALRTRR
ncbi:GNAT family N-acetyltransferase [Flexivirga oryzae]|uniref:CelD/BcsL family acetyltransferase involved in cellulose biosynthesis n=1 Tax=Flexivirga oryzae TaxID=1794944 RepID=A0A839N2J7_9MICO|nr:GNAT family N-acetyltransferase [Flexivirga oryzae]MBB2890143.1 CelD/BcsL family acetyltransferase involved in cellulose biosynthesis [Flexivirga oryzae]